MPSFRITLAYDGTDFAGSQAQANQRTVQGELECALARLQGVPTRSTFAGRTDRGVHAAGQVVAVPIPAWNESSQALRRALNATMPNDLKAFDVRSCDEAFNPRYDATWREYRYWIAPGVESPFLARYAWTPRDNLDVAAMDEGARRLQGTHDFASFAGGGEGVPWSDRARRPRGTFRTMLRCRCWESETSFGPDSESNARIIEIGVAADGFLPRMVRNIVAALVEIGEGRNSAARIDELLVLRDRRDGPATAPARGLTLRAVGFGDDEIGEWRAMTHTGSVMNEGVI